MCSLTCTKYGGGKVLSGYGTGKSGVATRTDTKKAGVVGMIVERGEGRIEVAKQRPRTRRGCLCWHQALREGTE